MSEIFQGVADFSKISLHYKDNFYEDSFNYGSRLIFSDKHFLKLTNNSIRVRKPFFYYRIKPSFSKRNPVREFSSESKQRFLLKIDSLADFKPKYFITLTVQNDIFTTEELYRKMKSIYDNNHFSDIWVWKKEFQKRGAPHFHLLVEDKLDLGIDFYKRMFVRLWNYGIKYSKKRSSCVKIEKVKKKNSSIFYFAKYLSKDKESQNVCPAGRTCGRFWGLFGSRGRFLPDFQMSLTKKQSICLSCFLHCLKSVVFKKENVKPIDLLVDSGSFFYCFSYDIKQILLDFVDFFDFDNFFLDTQTDLDNFSLVCLSYIKNNLFSLDKIPF